MMINTTSIRIATIADANEILNLYSKCTHFLNKQNMTHWDQYYNLKVILNKIHDNVLFILTLDNKPIGAISICTTKPIEYKNDNSVYLSGLAVLPKLHKNCHATQLLDYAENKALNMGFSSTSLDVLEGYKYLNDFYKSKGYKAIQRLEGDILTSLK